MPHDGRTDGQPYLRPFLRRVATGALAAVVVLLALPLGTADPADKGLVAGVSVTRDGVPLGWEPFEHAFEAMGSRSSAQAARGDTMAGAAVVDDRLSSDRVPFADRASVVSARALRDYRWPLPRGRLTLPYGPTPWGTHFVEGKPFHDGIDLATFCGDRIVAAHGGIVVAAGRDFDDEIGWRGDLGPYRRLIRSKGYELPITVVVDDGNDYRSIYAHFSRIVVKKGQRVTAGQLLGYEGATGHATGCHLHYTLFSPRERRTIGIRPDVGKRLRLPAAKTARVDPLIVLPPRAGDPPPLER